jgi:hypothetical protein
MPSETDRAMVSINRNTHAEIKRLVTLLNRHRPRPGGAPWKQYEAVHLAVHKMLKQLERKEES